VISRAGKQRAPTREETRRKFSGAEECGAVALAPQMMPINSKSSGSDIESGPGDDPFASLTEPSVNPSLSHTTLKGSHNLTHRRQPSVASLTTGDTTVASLAIDDSCVALHTAGDPPPAPRIIGSNSAPVSVGSARAASARIDSAGVVSAGHSVSAPNPKAKKGRGSGEAERTGEGEKLVVLVQEEVRG
jgi:hypothetical protein